MTECSEAGEDSVLGGSGRKPGGLEYKEGAGRRGIRFQNTDFIVRKMEKHYALIFFLVWED
jgi:hypothetical protein